MEPQTDRRKGTNRSESIIFLRLITCLHPKKDPAAQVRRPRLLELVFPAESTSPAAAGEHHPVLQPKPRPAALTESKPTRGEALPSNRANSRGVSQHKNRSPTRAVPLAGVLRPPQPSPFHLQADFMMEQKRQSTVQPSARQHPQSALASWAAFQSIIYNT